MGPIALFDKSFLQSLSADEAVWFDNFFMANICPVFFIETLADLQKAFPDGRAPAREVSIISGKTPEMHAWPNMFHVQICIADLLGHHVEMRGVPVLGPGKPVKTANTRGLVYEKAPEAQALSRWQAGKFQEVEKQFAVAWRAALSQTTLEGAVNRVGALGIDIAKCKSLADAKNLADRAVDRSEGDFEVMGTALSALGIPAGYRDQVLDRWRKSNYQPLGQFAPYAAYVFATDTFFCIAAATNLVSLKCRVDLAYLFYLPFCMIFVSSDRFHERCTPLFLRERQRFVWGADLKADLAKLDGHYDQLPPAEKEKGLYSFAAHPPQEGGYLVSALWDEFLPRWRERANAAPSAPALDNIEIQRKVTAFAKADAVPENEVDFDLSNPDAVALRRSVRKRRGKWWQVDKSIKPDGTKNGKA